MKWGLPLRSSPIFALLLGTAGACRYDYEVLSDHRLGGSGNVSTAAGARGETGGGGTGGSGGSTSVDHGGSAADRGGGAGTSGTRTSADGGNGGSAGSMGQNVGGFVGIGAGSSLVRGGAAGDGASTGGSISSGGSTGGSIATGGSNGGTLATGGFAGGSGSAGLGEVIAGGSSSGGVAGTTPLGGTAGVVGSGSGGTLLGGSSGTGGTVPAGGTAGATSLDSCQPEISGGKQYLFCPVDAAWNSARDACASVGMHLIRVDDAVENQWVFDTATKYTPTQRFRAVWLGATDQVVEGEWRWTDGTLFWLGDDSGSAQGGLYAGWYSSAPSASPSILDCAAMDFDNGSTSWVASGCTGLYPYVCEWP